MIDIQVKFDKKGLLDLSKLPKEFKAGAIKGVRQAMFHAERMSKRDFEKSRGGAGGLNVRSGSLRRSITSGVNIKGNSVVGSLGSNLIYARIHELSGTIRPRTGQYLRFQIEGQWKTVKSVFIPARPFLRPAIDENISEIKNLIRDSIIKEMNK